ACAIVSFRDIALKFAVVERVILYVHRELLRKRNEGWSFRDRPRLQGACNFQPEVVMQPRGIVTLDVEAALRRPYIGRRRFRRLIEFSFSLVFLKRHQSSKITIAMPFSAVWVSERLMFRTPSCSAISFARPCSRRVGRPEGRLVTSKSCHVIPLRHPVPSA